MKIDEPTFNTARRRFESEYGSLYTALYGLSTSERRRLLRYGKLSKKVLDKNKKDKVEELFHVSYVFRQILVDVIKPCYRRESIAYGKRSNEHMFINKRKVGVS